MLNIGGYGAERKGSIAKDGHVINAMTGAYTLDEMRDKAARGDWNEGGSDGRSSVMEGKEGEAFGVPGVPPAHLHHSPTQGHHLGGGVGRGYEGVKVTIDREVDYHGRQ